MILGCLARLASAEKTTRRYETVAKGWGGEAEL